MTDMDIKEIALVEDIAALGKIYCDCRASAAEQILQKIRDYAADLNAEGTENDNA